MIPVQNLYHMLAYAFRALHEQGYRDLATEPFENAEALLCAILCRGVSAQIKRGLHRQYLDITEPLRSPRGKLEIGETLKTQAMHQKQLVCSHDEFSLNAPINRILKTTMMQLAREDVGKARKKELRRLLLPFAEVAPMRPRDIPWRIIRDHRNQTDRMLLAVCHLALAGLLPTQREGSTRLMDYADDQPMARLYEKFLLGYYQREHPELKAHAPQIAWQVTGGETAQLPTMQTDIVLQNEQTKRTLIIDAKYYSQNMQQWSPAAQKTIHSAHLYQLFTYVKNWNAAPDEEVAGLLLYAKTEAKTQPDQTAQITGHQISAKTVDLNADFEAIKGQLDEIAKFLTA